MTDPSLDIMIVNWNAGVQLRECLSSIQSTRKSGVDLRRVVVIDNGSMDGSADNMDEHNLPVRIIKNEKNLGFATACNQAAKSTTADYLLFLNPDTRLFSDSLITPILYLERRENSQVGILGIQLVDNKGIVGRTCVRFPDLRVFLATLFGLHRLFPKRFPGLFMTEWDHLETQEVDQVMGAFFLVRRHLFQCLGGFDERFFVYYEDLDFALRARRAGWKSIFFAEAKCFHRGGGVSQQAKVQRLFYILQSRILYVVKHFQTSTAIMIIFMTLFSEPLFRLTWSVMRCRFSELIELFSAYMLLVNWLRKYPEP
ncbi:MAG: glycosyltransferase [Chitinivibrionales bacterium]|nr:glycosyltransferase [Chitinivibrionales bacterium]